MDRLYAVLFLCFILQGVISTSVYEPLVKFIKSKTNPRLIPRPSSDKPLVVDFQAGWLSIQDVDYEHNEIEGIFATSLDWYSGITWDPANFNGKSSVFLSSADVYFPVVTIINVVEKLETRHEERVSFYANGAAVLRTHYHGRLFCNEELQESNTCRIRVASYSTPSDVITFLEPSKRHFDFRKIFDKYYFKGSHFSLLSHSYEIHKETAKQVDMVFEHMDYIFSFREKESEENNKPNQVLIDFD